MRPTAIHCGVSLRPDPVVSIVFAPVATSTLPICDWTTTPGKVRLSTCQSSVGAS